MTAREAIESRYKGTCTITEYKPQKDETTKITEHQEVIVIEDKPCNLSFERISSTSDNDGVPVIVQVTRLFISPEVQIKTGAKITVKQNGVTGIYQKSGEPAVYSHHQEVMLQLFKGWS
jgi:hypothetical protein